MASIVDGARLALDQWRTRHVAGELPRAASSTPVDDADADRRLEPGRDRARPRSAPPPTRRRRRLHRRLRLGGDGDLAARRPTPTGILQVSPWSPYVGFTDAEPGRRQGRSRALPPSNGHEHASRGSCPSDCGAGARRSSTSWRAAASRGCTCSATSRTRSTPTIAQLIANDAPTAGITVVGYTARLDTETNTQPPGYAADRDRVAAAARRRRAARRHAGRRRARALERAPRVLPHAKLFAPSTLATPDVPRAASAPRRRATYVTSPILGCASTRRRRGACSPPTAAASASPRRRSRSTATRRCGRAAARSERRRGRATAPRCCTRFFHLGESHGASATTRSTRDGDSSLQTLRRLPRERRPAQLVLDRAGAIAVGRV